MLRRVLILSFVAMHALSAQTPQRRPAADSALLKRLAQTETQFFREWRVAWTARANDDSLLDSWKASLRQTLQANNSDAYMLRIRLAWSKWCGIADGIAQHGAATYGYSERMIPSRGTVNAFCPVWEVDDGFPLLDARADSLARLSMRGNVLKSRTALIAQLDSAATLMPGDGWIAGQRVRLYVEKGDADGALAIARRCSTSRWWCSALSGFVLASRGDVASADSAFAVATAGTGGEARCQWTDARTLLDQKARDEYAKLPCATRDSLSATLFWLANPLFSSHGNERRVEDYARKVSVALHSALEIDELYNWRTNAGGDALAQTVLRYGWPTRLYWEGPGMDGDLDANMLQRGFASIAPRVKPAYARGRIHSVPAWDAVRRPFDATPASWDMFPDKAEWWPQEHFAPKKPLLEICDDQVAQFRRDTVGLVDIATSQSILLRRDQGTLFAYATDLGAVAFSQHPGDTVAAVLIRTTGPDSIQRVAEARVPATGRLLLRALMPARPAVIGVEIPNTDVAMPAVRTRFGVRPPPSLAEMAPNAVAISDPVIVVAPPASGALSNEPDSVLRQMLGSTRLVAGTRQVGIYWETYGFTPQDSVEVSVRVHRYTSQGLLRSIGVAMRVTEDKNAAVSVSWREPDVSRGARVIAGRVPVIGRSLVLDVSGLTQGDYALEITVQKPGALAVVGKRTFVIQ